MRLGLGLITTPVHSPQANSLCERLIGTLRRECLDWFIPLSETHLRKILISWMAHYNRGRPHSSLGPGIPHPRLGDPRVRSCGQRLPVGHRVVATPILSGLHHEYRVEACGVTLALNDSCEKTAWQGVLLSVQPRIRLTRSFDQHGHTYLGYALRMRGTIGNDAREFMVGLGQSPHAKNQFRAGTNVSGDAQPVPDPRLETVEFYKVSKLKVGPPEARRMHCHRRGAASRRRYGLPRARSSAARHTNFPGEVLEVHLGLPDAGRDHH